MVHRKHLQGLRSSLKLLAAVHKGLQWKLHMDRIGKLESEVGRNAHREKESRMYGASIRHYSVDVGLRQPARRIFQAHTTLLCVRKHTSG